MKKSFFSRIFAVVLIGVFCFNIGNVDAYVSVKGYYRKNGTYVAPHVRSEPNGLKYDNYSYTPSQGLYNPSYGTKGTTWDTPTYITDPDYYVGKSIYDSNQLGTGYNFYPTTPSCPLFSSYDSISASCKCNSGYVVSGSSCISGLSYCMNNYGYGSEFDSFDKSCKCSYGYQWNDAQTSCVSNLSYCTSKFGYGARYNSLSKSCECSTGYEFDGAKCTYKTLSVTAPSVVTCPEGNVLKENSCITYTQDCTNVYGQNTYGQKGNIEGTSLCYCMSGYKWNAGQTACVEDESLKKEDTKNQEKIDTPPVVVKYVKPTVLNLRVRNGASPNGKVVGSVNSSAKYKIITVNNGWTMIRFGQEDSLKGWVMNKYIKEIE